ncbi:MAG TPA: hypothetical protein VIO14_01765 [Dehalococcoidia bacterium]
MPKAEVEQLKRRLSSQDLSEYEAYLETLKPGEWGAIQLEKGESQRVVKRRLTIAGKRKGITVRYKRNTNGVVVFEVK